MTFWTCRKNSLIRKVRSISEFMTSQLIEHPKRNIFLSKLCRKWGRETSSRPLFVFQKSFLLGKGKWSAARFHYILMYLKLAYNWNKLFKTSHYWSRDMFNFDFLDKGLGIVSPTHFVYDFSTKMFLMLYSINWPNLIAWLPLLLEVLGIMCLPCCDVMDVKINLTFLIKPFFLHDQKIMIKTLANEKKF